MIYPSGRTTYQVTRIACDESREIHGGYRATRYMLPHIGLHQPVCGRILLQAVSSGIKLEAMPIEIHDDCPIVHLLDQVPYPGTRGRCTWWILVTTELTDARYRNRKVNSAQRRCTRSSLITPAHHAMPCQSDDTLYERGSADTA
jgi:hypothetical protein